MPVHEMPAVFRSLAWAMPLRYGVDLVQAAYYAGRPAYGSVVGLAPVWDGAVLAALFSVFMLTGAAIFQYRERYK